MGKGICNEDRSDNDPPIKVAELVEGAKAEYDAPLKRIITSASYLASDDSAAPPPKGYMVVGLKDEKIVATFFSEEVSWGDVFKLNLLYTDLDSATGAAQARLGEPGVSTWFVLPTTAASFVIKLVRGQGRLTQWFCEVGPGQYGRGESLKDAARWSFAEASRFVAWADPQGEEAVIQPYLVAMILPHLHTFPCVVVFPTNAERCEVISQRQAEDKDVTDVTAAAAVEAVKQSAKQNAVARIRRAVAKLPPREREVMRAYASPAQEEVDGVITCVLTIPGYELINARYEWHAYRDTPTEGGEWWVFKLARVGSVDRTDLGLALSDSDYAGGRSRTVNVTDPEAFLEREHG